MIWLVLLGLSILPLSALLFGALFIKLKFPNFNSKVFIFFGLLAAVFDFYYFYQIYADTISKNQWTSSAVVMAMFPVLSSLNVMAVGFVANSIATVFKNMQRNVKTNLLVHALILAASVVVISYQANQHLLNAKMNAAIKVATGHLNAEIIQQIKSENKEKPNRTIVVALLSNPQVDENTLNEYANLDDVEFKAAVLTNPNVPASIVNELAKSTYEIIRYYVAANKKTSDEVLDLLLKDESKEVRGQAKTEYNLRKKQ